MQLWLPVAMMEGHCPPPMASNRFPVLEVLDGLRQLLYVPPPFPGPDGKMTDVWDRIARENPNWQLDERRQFTLNRAVIRDEASVPLDPTDPDGPLERIPYLQPFDPPQAASPAVNLQRPVLYDSFQEIVIQATSNNEPITGTTVNWRTIPQRITLSGDQSSFDYSLYLMVANQDNPRQRILRYMNWFNDVLRRTELVNDGELGIFLTQPPLAIRRIIDTMDRTPVYRPELTADEYAGLERYDVLGIDVNVSMDYLDDDSRVSPDDDTIFLRR